MAGATVQKVRERVLQLARDIEKLASANVPPEKFFAEFLGMVVSAIGARAGAVWMVNEQKQLGLVAGLRLEEVGLLNDQNAYRTNEKIVVDVISTGEACTHSREDGAGVELPSDHMLVLSALHKEKEVVGVVELFQRSDAPKEARPGYLQFLEQMCGYASRYIEGKGREEQTPEATSQFWTDFEQYVLRLQRTLDTQEVCDSAVSDGRLLLGCDRMSVAIKKGRAVKIRAVSGQATVNPRANMIRTMRKLAQRIIKGGEELKYFGKTNDLAPQVEKPLANFIQEGNARMVMMVPLFPTEPLVRYEEAEEAEKRKKKRKPPKAFGTLVIENMQESQPGANMEQRLEIVRDHVAASLWNARQTERIFLRPVWKFFGRIQEWFHGRKLAITSAVLAAVAAIGAALVFVPMDYRVKAEGKLMPVTQAAVFAGEEGIVNPPEVVGGQVVTKDDVLLRLTNESLAVERLRLHTEINNKSAEFDSIEAELVAARSREAQTGDQSQRAGLISRRNQILAEVPGLSAQLKNIDRQISNLEVRAPISGRIPDFQIEQLLSNRPVQAGQLLFHIMDDSGDWHLELKVEEKRMGHLLTAMRKAEEAGETEGLEIEFIPASTYDKTYSGRLRNVATRSIPDPELGSVVEITATIDDPEAIEKSIGSEVSAKISCGEMSMGYCLFGDVIETAQRFFWMAL